MAIIDFGDRYKDYSIFLPASTEMYARLMVTLGTKRSFPKGIKPENMDYLDQKNGFMFIPTSLYSAGQAAKTPSMAKRTDMILNRNKSTTTLVGDSGGFQIQTGAINYKGPQTTHMLMEWLEKHCDWSMILDFPTGGIEAGTTESHIPRIQELLAKEPYEYLYKGKKHIFSNIQDFCRFLGMNPDNEGEMGFAACLIQTKINNDYFEANRTPGATKFLNVVQGRTLEESNIWYEHIKDYDFEGWSLASHHKENLVMTLTRYVDLIADGKLEGRNWLHTLGVGKLMNGCAFTSIQRFIRENVNPEFTISYDASSPFTTTVNGNLFYGYTLDKNSWNIQTTDLDHTLYYKGLGSRQYEPFLGELYKIFEEDGLTEFENGGNSRFVRTEVGKRITMDDLYVYDKDAGYTVPWDLISYGMLMHHNVQVHMTAIFDALDMYDKGDVDHVPAGLLRLKELIPDILNESLKDPDKAKRMILNHKEELLFLAGKNARSGLQELTDFNVPSKGEMKAARKRIKEFNESVRSKIYPNEIEGELWKVG